MSLRFDMLWFVDNQYREEATCKGNRESCEIKALFPFLFDIEQGRKWEYIVSLLVG